MKKLIIIIFSIIISAVSFFTYWIFWKTDLLCKKDLGGLNLLELKEEEKKAINSCCKCRINAAILIAEKKNIYTSICYEECGYY